MNDLVVNEATLDSRVVAEMVGKEHKHLLRDIAKYGEYLGESKIGLSNYFIESTYQSEQNKQIPCYQITRKGCDLIAHKLTGKKGVLFTAQYIEHFERMKTQLAKPQSLEELVQSPELVKRLAEELIEARNEIAKLKEAHYDVAPASIEHRQLYTITDLAGMYGMGAKMFNNILWRLHIVRHSRSGWVLYAPYADKGYAERYWKNLKWTESGKDFLIKKLKQKGYTPLRVD